jgi:hypothetical protein
MRLIEMAVKLDGLEALQGLDLPEGKFAVGEYRGYDERESNGKMYYKLKLLVGDNVLKFDIKPDQVINITQANFALGQKIVVKYYDFQGKFGTNSVLNSYAAL